MTDPRRRVEAGHVLVLVVGLLGVSLAAPAMAAASAVPPLAMSVWRSGLGTLAVAGPALLRRSAELRSLSARQWRLCVLAGLALAGHFATWVTSLQYTSVASATALVSLQVAWVVVIERLGGIPVARAVAVGLALSLSGVLVVSGVDLSISTRAAVGDLLAVAGGMFAAGYLVVGGRVRERVSTSTYTFVCYGSCAGLLLAWCLATGVQLTGFSAKDWGLILLVTVGAQLFGHSAFNHLLAVMSPTVVSMALLLEVPGAALLAAVFLGQSPPPAAYAGLALVLAGLALVVRAQGVAGRPVEVPLD